MRALTLGIIGAALLCATPAAPVRSAEPGASAAAFETDFSAAKRRHRVVRAEPAPRYRHGPGTVACTRAGCVTVPPGCHAIRERTIDDSPSGFQIIIC